MQHNRFWKHTTKAVFSMRSYLAAFSLVLAMSGVASAQQEFRTFAPGLSPMMPVAGPEMLNGTERDAQDQVSAQIIRGEVSHIDRGYVLTEDVTGQDVKMWEYPGRGLKAEDRFQRKSHPTRP